MTAETDTMRYKLVPSQRPVLHIVGKDEADRLALQIATEDETGVAVCEDPGDPHKFRNLYIVSPPKKPRVK